MRIGICDDEQKELQHLQTLVKEFDSYTDVSLFSSAESLLEGIKNQKLDIVLLDIEMDGINGFDAARILINFDSPPLIIFVTNSADYTIQGYEVAFRYIPKPVDYTYLANVLTAAIARITSQSITINADGCSYVLQVKDIVYFETLGHHLKVCLKKDTLQCRMKIRDIIPQLPGNTFSSPHKSFLVNLNYVKAVGNTEISLTCGGQLPLSRRYKQEFEQALFRFVRR